MDLATAKRTGAERLHKLNEAMARLEIAEAKLDLLEVEKAKGSG
jgi:DNA-binding Xre family transcriptional regulator